MSLRRKNRPAPTRRSLHKGFACRLQLVGNCVSYTSSSMIVLGKQGGEVWKFRVFLRGQSPRRNTRNFPDFSDLFTQDYHTTWGMRHTVTFQEKSKGFANQTFRLLLVGRSRSGFSSPDSDTYYTLGLAVETTTESSMGRLGQKQRDFFRAYLEWEILGTADFGIPDL